MGNRTYCNIQCKDTVDYTYSAGINFTFNQFHHIIYTLWVCFFVFRGVPHKYTSLLLSVYVTTVVRAEGGGEKLHLWSS